jgi:predicted enzyme related to lactoylglutathione lyase
MMNKTPFGSFMRAWIGAAYVLVGCIITIAVQSIKATATGVPGLAGKSDQKVSSDAKEKAKVGRPVVHFEIGCEDSPKTSAFYTDMFDWQINSAGPAGVIDTGSKKGIQGHITSLGHEPKHYVTVYVEVEDIKPYLEKVVKLGGKVLVPAIKIPTGHFAWISDPDGNIIGLLQPNEQSAEAKK